MVRKIDWDAPLSDDDKAWLRDRDRHEEIAVNEARFAEDELQNPKIEGDEGEDTGAVIEIEDDYDKWKPAELKEEAGKREIDITGITKKADLIEALRTWDREHPEDGE